MNYAEALQTLIPIKHALQTRARESACYEIASYRNDKNQNYPTNSPLVTVV
ncbi:hypothetical protein SAMN04487890_101349 [Mucilaginibacter polytrichastri]|nr:hypothetical protein SAMN04487890_101349 [Mucilaginibacter polytrichastri]